MVGQKLHVEEFHPLLEQVADRAHECHFRRIRFPMELAFCRKKPIDQDPIEPTNERLITLVRRAFDIVHLIADEMPELEQPQVSQGHLAIQPGSAGPVGAALQHCHRIAIARDAQGASFHAPRKAAGNMQVLRIDNSSGIRTPPQDGRFIVPGEDARPIGGEQASAGEIPTSRNESLRVKTTRIGKEAGRSRGDPDRGAESSHPETLGHLKLAVSRLTLIQVISYILREAIQIYSFIVLAAVIVSWVAPHSHHPIIQFLRSVTEPVFEKVRTVVPAMGGLDLSPMIVLIALHFLQRII